MKFLISAGPTREKIDPVRYISNYSSGKMGYALAEAAAKEGHSVTMVSGPVSLTAPENVSLINVENASEMACEMKKQLPYADIVIMAAAVADYRPVSYQPDKIKKTDSGMTLELEKTEDVLASLSRMASPNQVIAGFAAETSNLIEHALEKLRKKNLDWIIANDVSKNDRGFSSDNNAVTMISYSGEKIEIPLANKKEVAEKILKTLLEHGKQAPR